MDSISTNFGAAAGVNWVVGHSSLVSPPPSIRFGPQKVKGKFHVTGAFQNGLEASTGNAGLGGKSSGKTTASVDDAKELQEEHDPEGHGAGTPLSPPLLPPCTVPSPCTVVDTVFCIASTACGGETCKDAGSLSSQRVTVDSSSSLRFGSPKGGSMVLGGLGSFVAGNPQPPPYGFGQKAGEFSGPVGGNPVPLVHSVGQTSGVLFVTALSGSRKYSGRDFPEKLAPCAEDAVKAIQGQDWTITKTPLRDMVAEGNFGEPLGGEGEEASIRSTYLYCIF